MYINLKLFAEHSQRIPSSFLAPIGNKKVHVSRARIFAAHIIDLFFLSSFLIYATEMIIFTANTQFLPTKLALGEASGIMELSVLPLTGLCYFFAMNLLNNGQSLGMKLLKMRVPTHQKGFYESFIWASRSMVAALSFGVSLLFTKSTWRAAEYHDYLYAELLAHKEHAPINLLHEIEKSSVAEDWEEEEFQIAA